MTIPVFYPGIRKVEVVDGEKKRNCLKNIESKENKLDSHGEHFIQGIEMPGITTTLTLKPDFSEKIYLAL